jgi:hypothetical protein
MNYRAFLEEGDNAPFRIEYYHSPKRWIISHVGQNNPIMNEDNWSSEIKYMNSTNENISTAIDDLPADTGGIYIFFIKGMNLPFIENYIVYIGRCRYTKNQNIRKRAKEYFLDERPMIKKMFRLWKNHLYYRYYSDKDNVAIDDNEVRLIQSVLPPFNEKIPDRIDIQKTVPAFN